MLYAIKTEHKEYQSTQWFLIVANSIEEAKAFCEDDFTTVIEVATAIETVINQEYDGCCMLEPPAHCS